MYIYLITNTINFKKYVGQTINDPYIRWKTHQYDANSNKPYILHKAIRKYGIENFKFEVIDKCTSHDELNELEIKYIAEFNTFKGDGYNMTSGGSGFLTDKQFTKERNKKISLAKLGIKKSKKTIERMKYGRKDNRRVVQYDINGNKIADYFSTHEAARNTICEQAAIQRVCSGKQKTSCGYFWSYYENKCSIRRNNKWKEVEQYTKNGVFLNKYVSTMDAERQTGVSNKSIAKICRKEAKSAGGYIWKYV